MEKRLGFIGIIINDREHAIPAVDAVIAEYADSIIARLGLPYEKKECNVITLIVDETTDGLGALTGKLGAIRGVSVKSALCKERGEQLVG